MLNITEVLACKDFSLEEREFSFKVYQSDEKDYYQLHEFIMKKQSNKYSLLSGQPNYGMNYLHVITLVLCSYLLWPLSLSFVCFNLLFHNDLIYFFQL